MAVGDDIQERFIDFAVGIVRLAGKLTYSSAEKHVGTQLLRSGTFPAPNYAEACSTENSKDSIKKLRAVSKELNESRVWLEIIARSKMLSTKHCSPLQNECDELNRIINANIGTSTKGGRTKKGP